VGWTEEAKVAWWDEKFADDRSIRDYYMLCVDFTSDVVAPKPGPTHVLHVDLALDFEVLMPPWVDEQAEHDMIVNTLAQLDLDYQIHQLARRELEASVLSVHWRGSTSRLEVTS